MLTQNEIKTLELQELKRKNIHSEMRRRKIDHQINLLSDLLPVRKDVKAEIIQGIIDYIEKLQSFLSDFSQQNPHRADIIKHLPKKDTTIMSLLPFYKPPKYIDLDFYQNRTSKLPLKSSSQFESDEDSNCH
jgi:hypothetical protein